ncbi:hypothetical protein Tco_0951740 [Tanacetum coccineum]|uniref:Uncharacterized protein n=1 Tax=Tanacetum coccineum TaxID=301880 RepID=A0ABQ5DV06_9ASTR
MSMPKDKTLVDKIRISDSPNEAEDVKLLMNDKTESLHNPGNPGQESNMVSSSPQERHKEGIKLMEKKWEKDPYNNKSENVFTEGMKSNSRNVIPQSFQLWITISITIELTGSDWEVMPQPTRHLTREGNLHQSK